MDETIDKKNFHNDNIISQFSKQAIPFTKLSQHSNQYGLDLMLKLCAPKQNDIDKIRWQSFLYADYNYLKDLAPFSPVRLLLFFQAPY